MMKTGMESAHSASRNDAAELRQAGELGAQGLVAALLRDRPGHQHQRGGEHQAGDDAADEQPPDRDVGDVAVDDQPDRGRDQRRDDRRARGDDGGEGGAVVRLHHLRAEDLREHRRVGRRRGGEAAEQGGEHGAHLRQRAGEVAGQRVGQGEQAPGDAGLVHDRAGEHEEGNRQQRIGVGGAHHLLHEDVERHAAVDQEERERRDRDRERDRRLQREQHQHQDAGDPVSPHWFRGRRRWSRGRAAAPAGSAAPSGRSRRRPAVQPGQRQRAGPGSVDQASIAKRVPNQAMKAQKPSTSAWLSPLTPTCSGGRQALHHHVDRGMQPVLEAGRGAEEHDPGEREGRDLARPGRRLRRDVARDHAPGDGEHHRREGDAGDDLLELVADPSPGRLSAARGRRGARARRAGLLAQGGHHRVVQPGRPLREGAVHAGGRLLECGVSTSTKVTPAALNLAT